jgi:hypothetical protein
MQAYSRKAKRASGEFDIVFRKRFFEARLADTERRSRSVADGAADGERRFHGLRWFEAGSTRPVRNGGSSGNERGSRTRPDATRPTPTPDP